MQSVRRLFVFMLAISATAWLHANNGTVDLEAAEKYFSDQVAAQNAKFKRASQRLVASGGVSIKNHRWLEEVGMYEVTLDSGAVLHLLEDGDHFVYNNAVFAIESSGLVNTTEAHQDGVRKEQFRVLAMNGFFNDVVEFPSKGPSKETIYVFTDVDCGYCRKLHKEVSSLNAKGITVRYLAFPRAGIYSNQQRTEYTGSYKKLKSVWCDNDRQGAMNKAKATGFIKENLGCEAPIDIHLDLGRQFGVRGTPAIMLQTGEMIPGYMEADKLAAKLGL